MINHEIAGMLGFIVSTSPTLPTVTFAQGLGCSPAEAHVGRRSVDSSRSQHAPLSSTFQKVIDMHYFKAILVILLATTLNCKKTASTCPDEIELGAVSLLQASKDVFPYSTSDSAVVFKDKDGNEIRYTISKNDLTNQSTSFNSICSVDESASPLFRLVQEYRTVEMFDEAMDKGFRVTLFTFFNYYLAEERQVADMINVTTFDTRVLFSNTETWKGSLDIILDQRSYTDNIYPFTHYYPSLELNGVLYPDVYVREFSGPMDYRKYYFNLQDGLIGYTDLDGETLFSFDRIE